MVLIIDICGESVGFSPIQTDGTSAKFYADEKKRYFLKVPTVRREFITEVTALRMLQKYGQYFPRLYVVGPNYFVINYIQGGTLITAPRPANLADQMKEAIRWLTAEKIYHRDIHPRQIMIGTDGQLWLIDYGRLGRHRLQSALLDKYLQLLTIEPAVLARMYERFAPNFRGRV